MDRFSSRSQRIGPKVHKNRRIDNRWGEEYHQAIQNIVFGRHCLPYMPTEPPASLSEEIVESGPLYVCKHCKDCFRFQSSFEDHNARHSWILGLWCHECFETVCTHTQTRTANIKCSTCTKINSDKRAYFRAKGINKSLKLGAVRVFYNQCQFVEHLKMHKLSRVNMGDLMLLPLPTNMSNSDWSTEFEILCEALMEWAFILRTHIIDWLELYNLQDNWWKLVNGKSDDDIINAVVNSYEGRQLFETYDTSTTNMDYSSSNVSKSPLDIEFIDDSLINNDTNNYSANIISDKNVLENEDNPCTHTDITFVDCGPTSQYFEPEIPVNYTQQKQVTAQEVKNCHLANTAGMNNKTKNKEHNLHETDMIHENAIIAKAGDNGSNKNLIIEQSLKGHVQQYNTVQPFVKKTTANNHSKTGVRKISDNPIKVSIPFLAKKSTITTTNLEQNLQTTKTNSNSKVLTLQDPKNIASIISQLSPHLISNKKLIVIGQDSRNVIAHDASETATKTNSSISINSSGTNSNTSTQKMRDSNVKEQEVTEQIIVRNGIRYLLKSTRNIIKASKSSNLSIVRNVTKATKQPISEHNTSKSRLTLTNSNEIENVGMEQTASLHNNISLLTPSPSPSELSSSSSCELHIKKPSSQLRPILPKPLTPSPSPSELSSSSSCELHVKKPSSQLRPILPKLQKVPPHLNSISALHSTQNYLLETISLIKEDNGDLYMDIKEVSRIQKESFRDVCDVIIKYRREMFDEFYQMNSLELKERLDHLLCVVKEMRQVLDFITEEVFMEKLRAVNTLQCILNECFNKYDREVREKQSNDVILNLWETKVDPVHKCPICNRLLKPKSYIAGFSKLPKNDKAYCSCYKRVCHMCLSYQGTMGQFIAHQNFHKIKKSKPYSCPDCHAVFESAISLEVHTWTVCFHTWKKQVFNCKICEIDGFRDLESITRHFVIMHSKTKVGCEDCSRVFLSYNEYVQHCTRTHPSKTEKNPIRLVICKLSNVILRCENYMTYLEKYPGIRKLIWFKCRFCHLITTDNKHVSVLLNNHIRSNHVETMSKILSKEAFIHIFGTESLKFKKKNSLQQFSGTPESDKDTDGTMVPKIVNTRTISSEIFEHGSEGTEYAWSTDINERRELLPRIVSIRGWIEDGATNDSKSSNSKKAVTKFSTETKEQSNSSSLQVIEMIETKDENPFSYEETAMELDDDKPNSNEETAKIKEPDKDNNELTMNVVCQSEKPLLVDTVDVRVDSPIILSKKVPNSTFERSTDSRIKIVDLRTICESEQFAEMSDIEMKDENASYMASIPKPPPLARMPQHLFEPVEVNELENEPENKLENKLENRLENKPAISRPRKPRAKKSFVRRVTNKSQMRIALGTDTQNEDGIDYLCHLCNERINTSRFVVQTHFREKHSEYRVAVITPRLSRMSPDFINGGYTKFINSKKRKSDSALFVTKRKRRWTQRKRRDVEMKDVNLPGLCLIQETAEDNYRDAEGNFVCKKCGEQCTDMPDLREHIAANHRLKGRYLICLECGENFMAAPSLQMHLKALHGIEDPISYMNQNPSYAPDDGDSQTGERTTVANQCYVCMAVFEDKAAVDKHLRVHGMAFLNRKRIEARNALEKKTVMQDDKPNITKNDSKESAKPDKPAETILEKINAAI
ncbi:uncharacterized protein [Temnothorax longispinosus]|uniref:uncharacterized protein isoform X1 n=1 Tax=Temnothorax longispinosus TaxID=300112 RepID=UPI003A99360B